jgi:hypothetical protein
MSEWMGEIGDNKGTQGVGEGIRSKERDSTHTQGSPSMVSEVEDKETSSASKPVTKKASHPTNPKLAKGVTMPEGKILRAGMKKATSTLPAKESTPGQTKSKTANVATLTQDQCLERATGGAKLDQTTSEETVERATVDQTTSEESVGGATVGQATTEESVGEATVDQATTEESVEEAAVEQATTEETVEGATGDEATSVESVRGARVDQVNSEAATGEVMLDQTTSEETAGESEVIQTPLASNTDKQTPAASPVRGATAQSSPCQLIGSHRILELGNETQVWSSTPGEREGRVRIRLLDRHSGTCL